MHVTSDPPTEIRAPILTFKLSHKDIRGIIPHEEDPLVINLQIHDWNVKKVHINLGI